MFDIKRIVASIRKKINTRDVLFIFVIFSAYLLTRIVNLSRFPIFCDEGIYIRWAKIAWHDASWRFISLTDGKQPLHTWGMVPFLKLFPNDALFGGRLFSVLTGFVSLTGVFVLLYYLFDKKTAFLGSILYVITPYFLFYDRLALIDSGVNAAFIWIFFLSILLIKTTRLDVALLFGIVGGSSLLAKSSVKMFMSLSLLSPILIFDKKLKNFLSRTLNYLVLFSLVVIFSTVIYNVQRLSPFFHYVSQKNNTFVMSIDEFLRKPLAFFFNNIKILPLYVLWESGFLVGLYALLGLIKLVKNNVRLASYIFLWIFLPFVAIVFFTKVLFPRYIIFFGTFLILLTSYYLGQIKNRKNLFILLSILIVVQSYFSYPVIFNPAKINFPEVDMGQYIDGVTAGWGVKEVVDFARIKSKEKPVILLAEGNFGLIADMLEVFVRKDDKISVRGYWPLNENNLYENQKELEKNYVYAVFPHRTEFPGNWPIKLIQKVEKPNKKAAFYFFELIK